MFRCKLSSFFVSKFSHRCTNFFAGPSRSFGGNQIVCFESYRMSNFFRSETNGFHGLQRIILNDFFTSIRVRRCNYCGLSDVKCWNCHQYLEHKKLNCGLCGALQYPKENINYFELLGISQKFELNMDDLSSKFRNMQMSFHPDKFVNKSKTEIEISEIYSRLINKAYKTLKDPLKRGFYLLELMNLPMQDKFGIEQEFLTSIMEKNEELESIKNQAILSQFMETNSKEINNHINLISQCFHYNNLNEAMANLLKLNYYINLDSKIREKKTSLMAPKEN